MKMMEKRQPLGQFVTKFKMEVGKTLLKKKFFFLNLEICNRRSLQMNTEWKDWYEIAFM